MQYSRKYSTGLKINISLTEWEQINIAYSEKNTNRINFVDVNFLWKYANPESLAIHSTGSDHLLYQISSLPKNEA